MSGLPPRVLSLPFVSAPILFGFPLHRRCCRVLTLHPMPRAARYVGRAEALGHNPFEAELAGMAENDVAPLHDVFIQLHGPRGLCGRAWQVLPTLLYGQRRALWLRHGCMIASHRRSASVQPRDSSILLKERSDSFKGGSP